MKHMPGGGIAATGFLRSILLSVLDALAAFTFGRPVSSSRTARDELTGSKTEGPSMKTIVFTSIAAGVLALGTMAVVPAAMAQKKPAALDNLHYEIYQPSQRLRTRRDNCSSDEDMKGAYCVKKCLTNFVASGNDNLPRCRSVEPLPPGVMPSAMRVQTGAQPLPPGTPQSRNKAAGLQQDPDKQ